MRTAQGNPSAPFQVGDFDAGHSGFELFFVTHRDRIARTLALALNDEALGYEAADEAMVRAYRDWAKVSEYSNPEGWVFRVGLNWGRSWIRRKVTAALKAPALAHSCAVIAPEATIADPDLEAAIAELGDDQRAVIVLRFYRDWSVAQIAEALNVPAGTIKSRLSRALRNLEDHLAADKLVQNRPIVDRRDVEEQ